MISLSIPDTLQGGTSDLFGSMLKHSLKHSAVSCGGMSGEEVAECEAQNGCCRDGVCHLECSDPDSGDVNGKVMVK